jgi:hypothetical protein
MDLMNLVLVVVGVGLDKDGKVMSVNLRG